MSHFSIRFAQPEDVPTIHKFICALAEYEHSLHLVEAGPEILMESLFVKKDAEVLIAWEDSTPVGFALFFHNFSTWIGKKGVYLEDLFVYPEYRSKGYGKALLSRLAEIAVERGCERLEWACLDWNTPSIQFYKALGAIQMDEWTTYRLTGDSLHKLAGQSAQS